MKYYTLIELAGDSESPMIGTLTWSPITRETEMIERLRTAISEHWDISRNLIILPEIEWPSDIGTPYEDITFRAVESFEDDTESEYQLRIYQTWMY